MARIVTFASGSHVDPQGKAYQGLHGLYAIADGGWFGVGLGEGRLKWGWLPNGHNDFIFAVIAEELGVVGCFVVLALLAVLAYTGLRIARRVTDPYRRMVAAAITVWLVGQATINIGGVVGLLPITGLPLPFISAGGTALVVTLAAVGMLAAFARAEPDAAKALHARPPDRWVRLLWAPLPPLEKRRPPETGHRPGRWLSGKRSAPWPRLRSVVLAGGGTGGHVYPLLAFADCLRRHDPDLRITCLGTARGLENEIIPPHGFDLRLVPAHQLPRSINMNLVRTPDRMWRASRATRAILDEVNADVVVGFGGYVSVPAYLAAWRRHTPIVVHEVNVPPGVANKLGMRFTEHVAVGFPYQAEQVPALRVGAGHRGTAAHLDRAPRPGGPAGGGPRPLRPGPRPADAVRLRRLPGRAVDQPRDGRRGQGADRRRDPGAAHHGRPQRTGGHPAGPAGAVPDAEVPRPRWSWATRRPTWRCAGAAR